jgi:acyl carrier protein
LNCRHCHAPSRTGKGYRSMSDTADRIRKILAAKFDTDEGTLRSDMSFVTDLNADSLDIVEISMAFENEFGIEIFDEDIEAIKTIGDAEQFIANAQ